MIKPATKHLLIIFLLYFLHICPALAQTPPAGVASFANQSTNNIVQGYTTNSIYVPTTTFGDLGKGYEFVNQGTGAASGGSGPYLYVGTYVYSGTDAMISFTQTSTAKVNAVYIQSAATGDATNQFGTSVPTAGGQFKLTSIKLLQVSGTSNVTVQAYANGVAVGSPVTQSVGPTTKVLFDFSTNSDFYSIDQIKITGFNTTGIRADDITSAAAVAAPTITVTATGNPGCGAGSVTLTASGGTPTGGTYSWYNSLSTLTPDPVLGTGTSFNPIVSGSYYAVYTKGATTITSTNTSVTINPIVSSPIPNAVFSYSFTGNTKDVSGNQNDGIPINGPTLTTDRYGAANSAYSFNGTNQFIETTTPNGNPQTFTISLWFNTTTTTGGRLAGISQNQDGTGSFDRHIYMVNSGQLYFGAYNGSAFTASTANSYNDGTWHHVVATLSSAGMKLYVDNVLQDVNSNTGAETQTNGYWEIGGNDLNNWAGVSSTTPKTSYYFKGIIDDVAIYNTDLSLTGVTTLNDLNQIGPYAPVCQGSPVTIYCPTITGATYTWTDPNGNTTTGQNGTFASAIAGNYTLSVTGGPGGCTSTATVPVTVVAAPVATFTNTYTPIANAANKSTVTYTGTNPTGYTYAWTITGGTPTTASGTAAFQVQWSAAGAGTVSLTVTNPTTGCSTTSTQVFNEANYGFSIPVTINAGNTTVLKSFPYLLSITNPLLVVSTPGCSNKVQYPNGPEYDFDFTDASNVEMPYEIESYDPLAGKLLVWVSIPSLATGVNTINVLFGSVTTPAHNTGFHQATWGSDYQAVYHFNESSFTGSVTDATSNGHTGTTTNMVAADQVTTGKVNKAYKFNGGTSNKKITASPVTITGPFTLSAWVLLSGTADQKIITNQTASGSASGGYKLGVYTNNIPEAEDGQSGNRGVGTLAPALTTTTYGYVQSVYTGTQLFTYVNGVQYQALSTTTNPFSTGPLYIGVGEGGSAYYFNGTIDEARVSNVAKSTDWLLTEYKNQNAPAIVSAGTLATNVTNAELIYGGMTFTTTNGGTSYTINSTVTTGTPLFNGKESFVIGGTTTASLSSTTPMYGLTVNPSATFNLNGQTLNVGCNIVNNGIISDASAAVSTVAFNGSLAAQSYTGTNVAGTATIDNLTINNTAGGTITLTGGPVDMANLLTLTQGNLFVDNTNNGALTLKGNASSNLNYAQIAPITSGYNISGQINYQVYFTGFRNYRSMASPVYNNTSTYSSTNGTYSLGSFMNPPTPATGFIITGAGGSTNGFDKSSNNGATLRLYNPASNIYTFISSISPTTPALATGTAFYMYFRGSRIPGASVTATDPFGTKTNRGTGSYATADPVMYTYTGVPNQGNVVAASLGATDTKFYFVANPYGATLDANAIISAVPIKTSTWIWNPQLGNYAVYNSTNSALTANGGKRYIVPGQGFFIQAATTGTAKTLTIIESMKSVTNNLNAARMLYTAVPVSTVEPPILRLKFAKDTVLSDEIAVAFIDSSKATLDYNDATHLEGTNLTLSSLTPDNQYLAIDVRPFVGNSTTIQLYITPEKDTTYTLNLSYKNEAINNYKISLKDSLLNTTTDISNNAYSFSVASGQANTYAKRFKLIIEQQRAPALFTKFTGKLNELKKVQLNWNSVNDRSSITYQVQRSTDKKAFTNIGQPLNSSVDNSNPDYQAIDNNPAVGINYYRLIQTDLFNNAVYSDTVAIAFNPGLLTGIAKNGFILYPNSVKDVLSLVSDKDYNDKVAMTIFDSQGNLKLTQVYQGISGQLPIQENVSKLQLGVYIIHLVSNGKELVTLKFNKEQN